MSRAGCPRGVYVFVCLAIAVGLSAPGSAGRARAEVWPRSASASIRGPLDDFEPGPLSLWGNPALLAAGPEFGVAAGMAEPFGASELARGDVAFAGRSRGLGFAVGGSRFGRDELAALAWAVGIAGALAGPDPHGDVRRESDWPAPKLSWGAALRRHSRNEDAAWALDVGARLAPIDRLQASVVARSAVRAGNLAVAPEPEWRIGLSWRDERAALALAIARDAVGPLAGEAGLGVILGGVRFYTVITRVAGGETRAGVGVSVRVGGAALAAAREVGPVLDESRAAAIEWSKEPRRWRVAPSPAPLRPRGAREPEAAPALDSPPVDSPALEESDDAAERALDRIAADPDEDRTSLPPENADDAAADTVDDLFAGSAGDPPAAAREPRRPAGFRTFGRLIAGGETSRARGAAVSLLGALARRSGRATVTVRLAGTRDAGERAGLDEMRGSLSLLERRRVYLVLGAYDLAIGQGLALAGTGTMPRDPAGIGKLARLAPAARAGRAELAPPWGGAILWKTPVPASLFAWWETAARDTRPAGGGRWPSGGRTHVSALERSRRGTLREVVGGAGITWRGPRERAELGLAWMRGRYGGDGARLLPGGDLIVRGDWVSISGRRESRAGSLAGEWALGPSGRSARAVRARLAPRAGSPSARFEWIDRGRGFDSVDPSPTPAPRSRVAVRAGLGSLGTSRGWIEISSEERWSAPSPSLPGRTTWIREALAAGRVERGDAAGSVELVATEVWRERTSGGPAFAGAAGPTREPVRWRLGAHVTWRDRRSRCRLVCGPTIRLARGVSREAWSASCDSRVGAVGWWKVSLELRPGALGASRGSEPAWERDPLGGLRFVPSASPASASARLRLPVAGSAEAGAGRGRRRGPPGAVDLFARWTTASGNPRFQLSCALAWGAPGLASSDEP